MSFTSDISIRSPGTEGFHNSGTYTLFCLGHPVISGWYDTLCSNTMAVSNKKSKVSPPRGKFCEV